MAPEQYARAKWLFQEALSLEKGDRRVFLEKECSNDKAVQMEVESLFLTPDEIEPRLKAQTAKSIVVMHSVMSRFH